ncbi:MAG: hypothetical protein ABFD50_08815 [Smithella sp.]
MKKCLRKQLITTVIFVIALLIMVNCATGGMVVFLKDGNIIQVPVNREDIIGISFEESSSATNKKIQESKTPAKSTGVDTCTHRFELCQSGADASYEKCKARAGSNADILAQCAQDSNVTQQACKNRFDQCIKD